MLHILLSKVFCTVGTLAFEILNQEVVTISHISDYILIDIYRKHIQDAVLGLEAISMGRLDGWENEMVHTIAEKQNLSRTSQDFLEQPTYGDGGMAAAVRIASLLGKENTLFLNREKK